ncbi:MAG: YdeI/OmpD-associated family protein [Candidatus Bathyarchaeota archaeon]|nr:YdeI/OmpD-associated family protein [Candidatus Bathyarchaeota archaeon]
MKTPRRLHFTNRDQWRSWLIRNHDVETEIYMMFYKRHTGKPNIPYDDAVEEALCFGWIDSIIRRINDEKFERKFTPRKSKSNWSRSNKKRACKMIDQGKMTEAGLEMIREAKKNGEWFKNESIKKEFTIPPFMLKALAKNKEAMDNFNKLAKSYKRQYVGWVASAKRDETRKKRLEETIRLLEKDEKLGMK